MKLIRTIIDLKNSTVFASGSVVTIGNYDGVHLGHRKILAKIKEKAHEMNLPSVVVVFEPQPEEFFSPETAPARLMNFCEKITVFHEIGIDYVVCLRFNENLAGMTAEDFILRIICDGINARYLVLGEDFRFGSNRKGNIALLNEFAQRYGFVVESVADYKIDDIRVSATLIRKALENGDLDLAKKLLGRSYRLTGRVVHGNKIGRTLGFPTANILLRCKVLPLSGVYVVRVYGIDKNIFFGVANIGFRPSVKICAMVDKSFEVHLLDFYDEIYRAKITVEFIKKIRDEKKFANINLLREQIAKDIEMAYSIIN